MITVNGYVYHVLNKSIAGYKIFNNSSEFDRMLETTLFYQSKNLESFSLFARRKNYKHNFEKLVNSKRKKIVEIIAYCFMPTHFHFLLRQLKDNGIPEFINVLLNSYTRYFNAIHKRKGPLWEGKTKKIFIETDRDLLHMSRYIHLNPSTAYLVDNPNDWEYSSYKEYIDTTESSFRVCKFDDILDIDAKDYKEFTEDRIDYQRDLKEMKDLFLE